MTYLSTIVDVEASALDGGFPIEIGLAFHEVARGLDIHEAKLIRHDPWLDRGKWCPEAELIHGITKEKIRDEGRPLSEVCTWMNDTIGPGKVHVGDIRDKMWLSQAFNTAGRVHVFQLEYLGAFMEAAAISQRRYFDYLGKLQHRAGQDALQMMRALARCMRP